jgi:hypothetical protein
MNAKYWNDSLSGTAAVAATVGAAFAAAWMTESVFTAESAFGTESVTAATIPAAASSNAETKAGVLKNRRPFSMSALMISPSYPV